MLYLIIPYLSINALSKNLSSKLNYLTKYHSCKKKESFSTKMLNSKKCTLSKIPTTKKRALWNSAKKNSKKKSQKKISKKKLKKGYQDFHAPK